jgi:hypothetical protein
VPSGGWFVGVLTLFRVLFRGLASGVSTYTTYTTRGLLEFLHMLRSVSEPEEWKLDIDFVKALSEYDEQSENDQKLVHLLDVFLASQGPVTTILKLAPPSTPAPVILLIYNICDVAKVRIQPTARKPTGN